MEKRIYLGERNLLVANLGRDHQIILLGGSLETVRNLPPDDTVRNLPPEDTVRNLPPEDTVKNLPPEETVVPRDNPDPTPAGEFIVVMDIPPGVEVLERELPPVGILGPGSSGDSPGPSSGKKCNICGYIATKDSNLPRHIRLQHQAKTRRVKCSRAFCDLTFPTLYEKRMHTKF